MYKEVAVMWKNIESYVDYGGVFGLSIIKHVTLQKIVAHDFRYDPRTYLVSGLGPSSSMTNSLQHFHKTGTISVLKSARQARHLLELV